MTYRVNGKKYRESRGTGIKKVAARVYMRRMVDISEGKWPQKIAGSTSMAGMIERYMKEVSPSLALSTHARNQQMTKNLAAFFGNLSLSEVTPSVVSRYKAEMLEGGYSKETIVRELGFLRRIYNIAIYEWELVQGAPRLTGIAPPSATLTTSV